MKLFPYDRFSLQTQSPLSAVIATLDPYIEAPRMRWGFSHDHAPYSGTLSESGFEIRRIIHYRNSFLPQIKGRFEPSSQGTVVHITLGLHPLVIAFLLLWLVTWYSGAVPIFFFGVRAGDIPTVVAAFALVAPIMFFLIAWGVFWYEARRSRRELTQIIHGQPLPAPSRSSRVAWRMVQGIAAVIAVANLVVFLHQQSQGPEGALPSQTSPPQASPSQALQQPCTQNSPTLADCNFVLAHTLTEHPTASVIALSQDGKTLVSGGSDKAIKVWDVQTGALKRTLQSDSGVITALTIAPDGQTVVSGAGDRRVRIWDIATDQPPQILHGHTTHDIGLVKVSADGTTIISGGYGEVNLWDRATGELKATLPENGPPEITLGPVTVKGSPPYFRLFDIRADGKAVLVVQGSKLIIWDLETDQQTVLPRQWLTHLNTAYFTPDGTQVVTTAYTQPRNQLKIWDLDTHELRATILLSEARESWGYGDRIAFSGDRVMASTPTGLKVWNLQTAELEANLQLGFMNPVMVSPDGQSLVGIGSGAGDAAQETQIRIWQRP